MLKEKQMSCGMRIRRVATEVFGITRGSKREPKDSWWWNDEVQKGIKEKKECFKSMYRHRSEENMHIY